MKHILFNPILLWEDIGKAPFATLNNVLEHMFMDTIPAMDLCHLNRENITQYF